MRRRTGASLAACFMAGLGCGTMYLYSGYAPQLASNLGISATDTSLIGMLGNIGMAFSGPFAGSLVDKRGVAIPLGIGAICLVFGYNIIRMAYEAGAQSGAVTTLALAHLLVGVGSTYVFSSLMKCAALNFPEARGIATSVPMAAFGLSAFVLSRVASIIFPGSTRGFLVVLSTVPALLFGIAFPFVRVYRATAVVTSVGPVEMTALDRRHNLRANSVSDTLPATATSTATSAAIAKPVDAGITELDWTFLVRTWNFWHHFLVLGLLGGIGQMYIYSCGYCVSALANGLDVAIQSDTQSIQVGVISLASFTGRLSSGFISDYIHLKKGLARSYLLWAAAVLSLCAQSLALHVTSVSSLWLVSAATGLAYGICYGSYPTIVADAFGMRHFSLNWGILALAPLPVSYTLNMLFGVLYDANSTVDAETGQRVCLLGRKCYEGSFSITLVFASVTALILVPPLVFGRKGRS